MPYPPEKDKGKSLIQAEAFPCKDQAGNQGKKCRQVLIMIYVPGKSGDFFISGQTEGGVNFAYFRYFPYI